MPRREPRGLRSTASPARRWTVGDVVDFEHLVRLDDDREPVDAAVLAACRRGDDRRDVFLAWLVDVRARSTSLLPGAVYDRGRRVVLLLAIVVGVAIGFGLSGTLLSHRDAEPVNALLFLLATVGVQLGILGLAAIVWAMRGTHVHIRGLRGAMLSLVELSGRATARLDGDRRTAFEARRATLELRAERLAPLVGGQLLVITQAFAIAFNTGLLASMLLVHLPFEELRFGWQTTYSFTAGGVDAFVRIASAPWHWLGPQLAPDALQIAATRFARGQRAETLPADAGHAWWPFLLCAIAFYGLALRTVLAVAAGVLLRRRLDRTTFSHPAANALWRRLQGPLVAAEGGDEALPAGSAVEQPRAMTGIDLLLVDRELSADTTPIGRRVAALFDAAVARTAAADIDDDSIAVDVAPNAARAARIVVATLASRDPIVAVAGFLRALQDRAGGDADITVVLWPEDAEGRIGDDRVEIWRRFAAIQRLSVGVERAP